jgi:hypothetical protein
MLRSSQRTTVASCTEAQNAWRTYLAFSIAVWLLLMGVYLVAGAFRAEFSGPDEAAYVVSGIMTREYLAGPLWHGESPLAFAQHYYASYPKVAIGHWPPVYFLVQGAWFLLTGVSRFSVLALSAVLSTVFASLTVLLCRREGLRWPLAATAGVVAVLLPLHLQSLLEIGSDVITSIAILASTLCCQRWIAERTPRHSVWFAVTAAIAVLCKGSAFVLVLVAPLALMLTHRQLNWLWSRETWRVAALSAALAGPWYYVARDWVAGEIVPGAPRSLGSAVQYAGFLNVRIFVLLGGIAMIPLVLLSLRTGWYRRASAMAVLPIATFLFLTFASPHTEPRLFLHVLPIAVFAAATGANVILPKVPELVLLGALVVSHFPWILHARSTVGFVPAVSWLQSSVPASGGRILVTSNGSGEGAFISELALREPHPNRTVIRASKVLQSSSWMGNDLRVHGRTAADVARILADSGITLVVRHTARLDPAAEYEQGLDEVLRRWRSLGAYGEVRIYARALPP